MSFSVPPDGLAFCDYIFARSSDLIDRGIWGGMKLERLRKWYKNFQTDAECYFAACVIDSLIYRSNDQTDALVRHLFQRPLVDLTRRDPPLIGAVTDWVERLKSINGNVRLVAAIKKNDRPHKSAHWVSRSMKRLLGINPDLIAKPWELTSTNVRKGQILIFIDDFLGTGDQFKKLIQSENLDWIFSTAYVVYAPFAAYKSGIEYLNNHFPLLRIAPSEILEAQHCLFSDESRAFADGINKAEFAKDFYLDMLRTRGLSLAPDEQFGFGGLGLTYVFEHAVPDNNLPLLWCSQLGPWVPLFDR